MYLRIIFHFVRWHLPIGLLYDMLGNSNQEVWKATFIFIVLKISSVFSRSHRPPNFHGQSQSTFLDSLASPSWNVPPGANNLKMLRQAVLCREAVESIFMSSLKESDQLKTSGKVEINAKNFS